MHNYHLYVCRICRITDNVKKYEIGMCKLNHVILIYSRLFKYCITYPYFGYIYYKNGQSDSRLEIGITFLEEKYVELTIKSNNITYEIVSKKYKDLDREKEIFNEFNKICKFID